MNPNIKDLENRLWEAADYMRANSSLRLNEFAEPVLGLIFLKFAGVKFSKTEKEISVERRRGGRTRIPRKYLTQITADKGGIRKGKAKKAGYEVTRNAKVAA